MEELPASAGGQADVHQRFVLLDAFNEVMNTGDDLKNYEVDWGDRMY